MESDVPKPPSSVPNVPPLPSVPAPQGFYVPAVVSGTVVASAGMTPRVDGALAVRGVVGTDLTVAEAASAAGVAARNALAAVGSAAGGLERLDRCIRMTVFIACAPGFTELSAVADGASAALAQYVGEAALPARSAIGVLALPSGAPVEVELTATVKSG